MVDSGLHERIREVVGRRTYRAVGELTGMNAETVRRYLHGQAPSVEFVSSLCEALGVSTQWLLTGAGARHRSDERAAALREAQPGELLEAIAGSLEALAERVDRIESYVQTLEAGLRARPGTAGEGASSDGERTTSEAEGSTDAARARARRVADAVPERPRSDAD